MFSALHECGHVSLWRSEGTAPKAGDLITCFRCGHSTRVTELFGPWRVQCLDCTRVNAHATFKRTCERAAVAHAQEWTTHRLRLWQYGHPASVVLITAKVVGVQPALFTDAPF